MKLILLPFKIIKVFFSLFLKIILLPFKLLWTVSRFILKLAGKTFSLVIGGLLILFGIALIFTVVGIPFGIPILILGVILFF